MLDLSSVVICPKFCRTGFRLIFDSESPWPSTAFSPDSYDFVLELSSKVIRAEESKFANCKSVCKVIVPITPKTDSKAAPTEVIPSEVPDGGTPAISRFVQFSQIGGGYKDEPYRERFVRSKAPIPQRYSYPGRNALCSEFRFKLRCGYCKASVAADGSHRCA
jgi:hypothetical protein